MKKEVITVYLKEGIIPEIVVDNPDEKSYTSDGSLFILKKYNEYSYLVPSENILLISNHVVEVK